MDYFHDDFVGEEFSDEDEPAISSGDDEDDFFGGSKLSVMGKHGKVNLKRLRKKEESSESEDEFDKEMNQEMDSRARQAEEAGGIANKKNPGSSQPPREGPSTSKNEELNECYDDIYFDSDDEDDRKKSRKMQSDADLFYDPKQDENDQKWVDDLRRSYQPSSSKAQSQEGAKIKPLPNSDAVLNCPACFACVCMDCQRHDLYHNQYRAMFVMNCSVDMSQRLKFPVKQKSKSKKKGKKAVSFVDEDNELYNPVKCDQCKTEIAVFDKEEVYHFFNVISSH